jgi:hypothetical protein
LFDDAGDRSIREDILQADGSMRNYDSIEACNEADPQVGMCSPASGRSSQALNKATPRLS